MRPDPLMKQIFSYCLAEASQRYGVKVIAWDVMSNHYHSVVHDPDAQLPKFLGHLNKLLSKCVNHRYGRRENVFSSEETCVTRLMTQQDVDDKVAYVLANPVAAHLVDKAGHWPGASSWDVMGHGPKTVKRPPVYFRRERSKMPETVTLEAAPPPWLKGETYEEWTVRMRRVVATREDEARAERRRKGIPLVGRKRVLSTEPTYAPPPESWQRKLKPALACLDRARMKVEKTILKGFRTLYALARLEWEAATEQAKSAVIFPAGTYRFREWGLRCAPFPPMT